MSVLSIISVVAFSVFLILAFIARAADHVRAVVVAFGCAVVAAGFMVYGTARGHEDSSNRCAERCGELRHTACGTLSLGRHNDEEREYSVCETSDGHVLKLAPKQ